MLNIEYRLENEEVKIRNALQYLAQRTESNLLLLDSCL